MGTIPKKRHTGLEKLPSSHSHPIDRRLQKLLQKVEDVKNSAELHALDDEIPIEPVPRMAPPNRPRKSWAKTAAASAAEAAASAAAKRAAAANAESKQRRAAAERAAVEAQAAEDAAAATASEAAAAARAAAECRIAGMRGGEHRQPPRSSAERIKEYDGERTPAFRSNGGDAVRSVSPRTPAAEALREHVSANDWVAAARVAVAMAIQSSLDGAGTPHNVLDDEHDAPLMAGGVVAHVKRPEDEPTCSHGSNDLAVAGEGSRHQYADRRRTTAVQAAMPELGGQSSSVREPPSCHVMVNESCAWPFCTPAPVEHGRTRDSAIEAAPPSANANLPAELLPTGFRAAAPTLLTPRTLRAMMIAPTAGSGTHANAPFAQLVDEAEARERAADALVDIDCGSGQHSFVGVAQRAAERAARAQAERARHGAQIARKRGEAERRPIRPLVELEPRAAPANLRQLEASERKQFERLERRRCQEAAAAASGIRPPEERIAALLKDLDSRAAPRNYDDEIADLARRAADASRV